MKSIALWIFLLSHQLFFNQKIFSQTTIEGIANFKVGKSTISIIDSLAKLTRRDIVKCDQFIQQFKSKNNQSSIFRLLPNIETNLSPNKAPYDSEIKVFQINNYSIINKYDVQELYLFFYKDTLYEISANEHDYKLDEDIKLKYGNPTIKEITSDSKCTVAGYKYKLPTKGYYSIWNNDNIQLTIYSGESYTSSSCEKFYLHFLNLEDKKIKTIADKLNSIQYSLRQNVEKEQKIKGLDSL